jgi:hypothetical protein
VSDYSPVYTGGVLPFTMTAGATITGGQVVFISGVSTVSPTAGANGAAVGVAAHDATSGGRVSIWPFCNVVHETTNSNAGTITAGAPITSGSSGGVDTGTLGTLAAAGTLIGTAVTTAATATKVRWTGR